MLTNDEIQTLLPEVVKIAQAAGAAIDKIYQDFKTIEVSYKSDDSPVTNADIAANTIIVEGLQAISDLPIISEELPSADHLLSNLEQFWLVDPLDGTRCFVNQLPEFTVNIALINDGKAVLGVIFQPISKESYFAVAGGPAYLQEGEQSPAVIKTAAVNSSNKARLLFGHSFDEQLAQSLVQKYNFNDYQCVGSSLKMCLIAAGKADLYLRVNPTSLWDTAAAQCVLEAAGGNIVDFSFNDLSYVPGSTLLNPSFAAVGDLSMLRAKLIEILSELK